MKKNGFTLAEVLITLGIIGVVAVLTAPVLLNNTGSAQIGPKLAKAVSSIEVATDQLLMDESAAKVSSFGKNKDFAEKLTDYMRLSLYDSDGSEYGSSGKIKPTSYGGGEVIDDVNGNGSIDKSVKYRSNDGMKAS